MNTLPHSWLIPSLCVGDVFHARTRPKRNVFKYPIFYLRLPLSRLDSLGVAGLAVNQRGLCQILNKDHGPQDGSDLLTWVRDLLANEGLGEVTEDGEVMLQTMPRIFGYLFNPVSFYFCHDRENRLRAVICEVSNTFGEGTIIWWPTGIAGRLVRRMYFMQRRYFTFLRSFPWAVNTNSALAAPHRHPWP